MIRISQQQTYHLCGDQQWSQESLVQYENHWAFLPFVAVVAVVVVVIFIFYFFLKGNEQASSHLVTQTAY